MCAQLCIFVQTYVSTHTMKTKILLVLLACILYPGALCAEYFKHIGLTEGLTQPSVMAIYQDQQGCMWFGTREGLNRYNGHQLTVFKGWTPAVGDTPAVWLGNETDAIVGNNQGDIFFLIDGDLITYNLQTERFHRLTEGNKVAALTSFEGEVWYIKEDSLFRQKDTQEAPVFVMPSPGETSSLSVHADRIYVGTIDGVFIIDRATLAQTHLLPGIDIYSTFLSSQQELWIGTRMKGLYRKTAQADVPAEVPYVPGSPQGISSRQIREITEDNDGNIWFGTFDGLHKFDAHTQTFSLIQIPKYMGGLNHPSIFSLYKDIEGTIWIGSYYGGVNYFNPSTEHFAHYDYESNAPQGLYYSYIGELTPDRDGNLWFGTDGGGVGCTDAAWHIVRQLTAGPGNALPHNNIKSISYDEAHHCLYIATHLGGLSRYDIATNHFHNYLYERNHNGPMPNDILFHTKMWKGQLYLSARNGVFRLDTHTQQFHKLPVPAAYYEHFDIDPEGNLYLISWNHVYHTHVDRPDSLTRIPLVQEGSRARPSRVLATTRGAYIGTLGAGLFFFDNQTHQLTHYTAEKDGLASDFCYNLCRTASGKIIITSDRGVSYLSPTDNVLTSIDFMSNFHAAHLINGCGIYASDEYIFMGDTKGVTLFTENVFDKPEKSKELPLYFARLWVNNQPVRPQDKSNILEQALPYTDRLRLKHDQNNLVIQFAHPNFGEQLSEQWFQYQLEGFDKEWVRTRQTELYYTNLDPGTYTLRVATIDGEHPQENKEIKLQICILTPWYNTWWAWFIYLIVSATCVLYYVSIRVAKRTLALSLEKERFEKQQIEQLNHAKLVFFTNVSHEFRTPLTLIISHIDILMQKYSLSPSVYNQILKIRKNAQHMNNLISELLEFRKLEQNYETLQLKQQNITAFLKEIYLSFADYARQREINYAFKLTDMPVTCWFDPQLMEKVFFNLLSNAFKYTANKGSITLRGETRENEIIIHISDTGVGISRQDTDRIFDRFYQSEASEPKNSLFRSTGIGLALTKTIVEKHHGEITVESTVGEGSTFSVRLPRRKEVFANDQNVRLLDHEPEVTIVPGSFPVLPDDEHTPLAAPEETDETTGQKHTLLLVEDNEELLQTLDEIFAPFYQTLCAHNGKEGLQLVYDKKPDLVISDVMMPEMTGTEMCLQIKNNIDFCHIPVILLTALNSPEQNLEGLNRGADDYITKPFHAQLLLARANNLIRNRLLMQHQFDKKPLSEIDLTSINPLDKDLLKRAVESIEQHIDDTEFDIPVLCREIGIGRSLLYTKFKALTGMTPNNFILNHRLKHAATLLKQYADLPIAEVSDRCGFSTPVYFSRCFKAQYGCTPQSYKKGNKGDQETETTVNTPAE